MAYSVPNTVASQVSKYQANAVTVSNMWSGIIVNVKASPYLAKGDGVTDDTEAIQAAIDYAISIGKEEVTFPVGTYIYGVLTNTEGMTFIGDGVTLTGTTPITLTSISSVTALKAESVTGIVNVVTKYGADPTGVTDSSAAFQLAVNYCLANGCQLYIPKGTYLIGTAVHINYDTVTGWTDFTMYGDHVKSAYSDLVTNEGTIIKTNGNDAFIITPEYPCSSINIKRIHGLNSSSSNSGNLFKFDMGLMTASQLKTLWVDEVTGYKFDNIFYFVNTADANLRNLPYVSMNRVYSYLCSSGITIYGCGTTIFKLTDSLFHAATLGGFVFPMGEYQFDNVWFEGCEPAGIVKNTASLTYMSLNDTYFEACGTVSGSGAWQITNNTHLSIMGRSNLPGTLSMPAPVLPSYCTLSAYTDRAIGLKLNGGVVYTPENVNLDLDYTNYGFYPISKSVVPERGAKINNSFSSGNQGGFGTPSGNTPPILENNYTWAEDAYACDFRGSLGTNASARVLVSSFIYYAASGANMGLGPESAITLDGALTALNQNFVHVATDDLEGLVCVVTVPVAANVDVTRFTLQVYNDMDVSLAYTNFQLATGSGARTNMAKLGHPQTKKYVYNQTIATAANYTFLEKLASLKHYFIKVTLILGDGLDGVIVYSCYGRADIGGKYRDVIGASKNVNIVVTASDGAALDMYNINVANTTGANIKAKLIVEY